MHLYPGSKVGYSKVLINTKKEHSPYSGFLGVNNYGSTKSGKYLINAEIAYENPLSLADKLSLNFNTTDKQNSKNNSLGGGISYHVPIGRVYLGASYSDTKYTQMIKGKNSSYKQEGHSKSTMLSLEYKLFHNRHQKGTISSSLVSKENRNYLAGVYLKSSSSRLSIANISYMHNFIGRYSNAYVLFGYYRGMDILGARSAKDNQLKFDKYTIDLNYQFQFPLMNLLFSFNPSLHAQYASKNLIASEYIGVGGPYSVRGYKSKDALSGNRGLYLRDEIAFMKLFHKGMVQPYFGVDYGWIKNNSLNRGGRLLGGVFGIRSSYKGFNIDLSYSKPIEKADDIDKSGYFGLNANYNF